uniref:Uncharacterized protein n=1 Tax=Aegilops tauschii subsp. strangulata TaxID=200361 RepID=A0A453L4Y5_AEGTS
MILVVFEFRQTSFLYPCLRCTVFALYQFLAITAHWWVMNLVASLFKWGWCGSGIPMVDLCPRVWSSGGGGTGVDADYDLCRRQLKDGGSCAGFVVGG